MGLYLCVYVRRVWEICIVSTAPRVRVESVSKDDYWNQRIELVWFGVVVVV